MFGISYPEGIIRPNNLISDKLDWFYWSIEDFSYKDKSCSGMSAVPKDYINTWIVPEE